ncbi:popeye domain-containing protein 3 [Clarias magur]|uniref:Popeye domain-containing protein 3 n=1 Tax=Clarias magur TaxID=1594786 RepID=A0A8J4UP18_CLAMG|nr:popeye domain-containing protein 3 [Clarias magur]
MEPVILLDQNNLTMSEVPPVHPLCTEWKRDPEGSVFHLANMLLVLSFMGGSGFYGLIYMFSLMSLGFLCYAFWAWSNPCTTDSFSWAFVLFLISVAQVVHVIYRLRSVTFDKDFQELYGRMFKKLGVSLIHFGKIVSCCEQEIHTIEKDHYFAVEGKTPIDKLSVLLSGR